MQGIVDQPAKPPQISEMFQKFAIAFKTKTFEFFADDAATAADEESDGFSLLDSAEEIITDQKVVVIKPDNPQNLSRDPQNSYAQMKPITTEIGNSLISSLFATISSFEASYLQLQTAHVPFVEESVVSADRLAVSHLKNLSEIKQFCRDLMHNPKLEGDFSIGSCLEAQVQENQSKLRALETVSNRLQAEIDGKDAEVWVLKQELDKINKANAKLSKRLSQNSKSSSSEVLLSVRVFNSVLQDACRSIHKFTKLLIDLMRKAKWDLDLAANSVYSDIDYVKKKHNRYAFLSYVCLVMFRGFDSEGFGLSKGEIACNGNGSNSCKNSYLKQLVEHVSCSAIEILNRNQSCEFSMFCEKKYQELIHPTMESSIFSNLDRFEAVLNSWRSLSVFYESFVNMASSIWILHKLALSFDPVVEIFQVERGADFSLVYMEDVKKRSILPGRTRAKVAFTVVPGFKIGTTVIQAQVYVTGVNCTES